MRSYADLKKARTQQQHSTVSIAAGDDAKPDSYMEISKLYFYEEVVDLLPIKMVYCL